MESNTPGSHLEREAKLVRVRSNSDLTFVIFARYGFASFDPTRPNFASSLWRRMKFLKTRTLFVSSVKYSRRKSARIPRVSASKMDAVDRAAHRAHKLIPRWRRRRRGRHVAGLASCAVKSDSSRTTLAYVAQQLAWVHWRPKTG